MSAHVHQVLAHNYAHDSPNKIHDDAIAAKYGFTGGLVPGAADFGYLCQPVYHAWGDPWLRGGAMQAKFIKPIYHGEMARAEARETGDPGRFELALIDPRGVTCAIGRAELTSGVDRPAIDDFPRREPLAPEALSEPTIAALPAGHALAAFEFDYVEEEADEEAASLFVEPLRSFEGKHRWHPALATHYANKVVTGNVRLDAWIHTGSRVYLFDQPRDGERLSMRGTVANTYEKRGHIITEFDLAMFADETRAIVSVHHTSIVQLALQD